MTVKKLIEEILLLENPTEALRKLVIDMNNDGLDKDTIYDEISNIYNFLQNNNREQDADVLADVMDMMTGWYVGRNLDLK